MGNDTNSRSAGLSDDQMRTFNQGVLSSNPSSVNILSNVGQKRFVFHQWANILIKRIQLLRLIDYMQRQCGKRRNSSPWPSNCLLLTQFDTSAADEEFLLLPYCLYMKSINSFASMISKVSAADMLNVGKV